MRAYFDRLPKKANMGWVYLGILMLHLYIPSIPRNPNVVNVDLKSRLSITYKSLADEIELQQIGELLAAFPSSTCDSTESRRSIVEAYIAIPRLVM
jgi:hypothetical protein